MKIKYIVLVVLLVVLVILAISCSCMDFKPFSEDTIFSKEYKYEGFNVASIINKPNTKKQGFEGKTEGFEGFFENASTTDYYAPYTTDGAIDVFSGTPGSKDCEKSSSGLTNSKGGLCLNDTQKQLLQTRGGNATGVTQIGM
jgi:hypothetical protein